MSPVRNPQGPCLAIGCDGPLYARGYCSAHYKRLMDGREINAPMRRKPKRRAAPCDVSGCFNGRYRGELCAGHWSRKRNGRPDWAGPLRVSRKPAEGGRRGLGLVSADLVERLDRIAKSRRITRIMLVESTLQSHFAKEEDA